VDLTACKSHSKNNIWDYTSTKEIRTQTLIKIRDDSTKEVFLGNGNLEFSEKFGVVVNTGLKAKSPDSQVT
jgi:hypothetical protein